MMIQGSIGYTYSGRKKKRIVSRKPAVTWQDYTAEQKTFLRETPDYPSYKSELVPLQTPRNTDYKKEISSNYTISIPYNKGGYQVISHQNVKDIGK